MQRLSTKIGDCFLGDNRLWNIFSRINMLYILPTNSYYGTRVFLKSNKNERKKYNDQHIPLMFNSVFLSIGLIATIMIKTSIYLSLGPIGTMRIMLSYAKMYETGDGKYVEVINTPTSSLTYDSKYILPYIDNNL